MSGIFGVVLLSGTFKNALSKERMSALLSKMATGTGIRGKDATGLAAVGKDKIHVIKRDVEARIFVKTKEFKNFLTFTNLLSTYAFLGHCRDAQKGSNKDPENNSPMVCGNIVGAHNGYIVNDNSLFRAYEKAFVRKTKTECEIVFSLLNHWTSKLGRPLKDAIKRVAEVTNGTSTYACINAATPSIVCLSRSAGNPLEVKLFEEEGLILFSSSEYHLDEAAKTASMSTGEKIPLGVGKALLICSEQNEFAEVALT